MEAKEYTAKTVEEALTNALADMGLTSDQVEVVVIEEGSTGFLGIGSKDAKIKVTPKVEEVVEVVEVERKEEVETDKSAAADVALEFLNDVFQAMDMEVSADINYDEEENELDIDLSGPEMGVIIGKRGQTLDSLQYLTNLAVNRKAEKYTKVKIDTEDYRRRRKETLENLAKNMAYKAKKTRRPVAMEPMNPYERRIIHSALQDDKYVTTHSEGEEPYRHVVITLK